MKKPLWLSCQQSARLLSAKQDQPLVFKERIALKIHLFICTACRRFNKQMQLLHQAMKSWKER